MKKMITGIFIVLGLLLTAGTSVFAAPASSVKADSKLFYGTYKGFVSGDKGSKALLTLELSQSGELVYGTVFLDRGLYVDAGRCGGTYLPSTIQKAEGRVNSKNPRLLETSTRVNVSGVVVNLELEGVISPSGKTLTTEVKIDLPWLCGRDPVIDGTLIKQ